MLLNITGGPDLTLNEINEAAELIRRRRPRGEHYLRPRHRSPLRRGEDDGHRDRLRRARAGHAAGSCRSSRSASPPARPARRRSPRRAGGAAVPARRDFLEELERQRDRAPSPTCSTPPAANGAPARPRRGRSASPRRQRAPTSYDADDLEIPALPPPPVARAAPGRRPALPAVRRDRRPPWSQPRGRPRSGCPRAHRACRRARRAGDPAEPSRSVARLQDGRGDRGSRRRSTPGSTIARREPRPGGGRQGRRATPRREVAPRRPAAVQQGRRAPSSCSTSIQSVDSLDARPARSTASPASAVRAGRCRSCCRSTSPTIRPRRASRRPAWRADLCLRSCALPNLRGRRPDDDRAAGAHRPRPRGRPSVALRPAVGEPPRSATRRLGPALSMGMTDDFEAAVEEGATIVRIGRALFGERPHDHAHGPGADHQH